MGSVGMISLSIVSVQKQGQYKNSPPNLAVVGVYICIFQTYS